MEIWKYGNTLTVLHVCRPLLQKRLDTFATVREREAAVVQSALNFQSRLQSRRLGWWVSVSGNIPSFDRINSPANTACFANPTAGAEKDATLRAISRVASRTSSSGDMTWLTMPNRSISKAVTGDPVNMSSMAFCLPIALVSLHGCQ